MGIWPMPVKNHFLNLPLTPGWVKYSSLAGKVTRRESISGRKNESATARWLLASSAPPLGGMFSAPSTSGRKTSRSSGPRNTHFIQKYSTAPRASLSARPTRLSSVGRVADTHNASPPECRNM